jgi:hypothetical protein
MFKIFTPQEALLLLEMCIDAEERCNQRIQEARDKDDRQGALDAVQQKERYEILKRKIVAGMEDDKTSLLEDSAVFSERVKTIIEKK